MPISNELQVDLVNAVGLFWWKYMCQFLTNCFVTLDWMITVLCVKNLPDFNVSWLVVKLTHISFTIDTDKHLPRPL